MIGKRNQEEKFVSVSKGLNKKGMLFIFREKKLSREDWEETLYILEGWEAVVKATG